MEPKSIIDINKFLLNQIGLSSSAIDLGLKLAHRNRTSLPIALWSHGILTTNDLHKLYTYIYKTNR